MRFDSSMHVFKAITWSEKIYIYINTITVLSKQLISVLKIDLEYNESED